MNNTPDVIRPPRTTDVRSILVPSSPARTHGGTLPRRPAVRLALGVTLTVLALAACGPKKTVALKIEKATVQKHDIKIDAEATGNIEAVAVVDVKSKASGQIINMPVETGSIVKKGDLLVQLDTKLVDLAFTQAQSDYDAAVAKLALVRVQRETAKAQFEAGIMTPDEYQKGSLDTLTALSSVVRLGATLETARQNQSEATVRAPIDGTVISKPLSVGSMVQSSTQSTSTGTTLLSIADLKQVQARALINETDIGNVAAGYDAVIKVDAYPDEFPGVVAKIEPTATVQQSVTMFPVLISLQNDEGLLRPGMNAEIAIHISQVIGVVSVPSDAIRQQSEAKFAATLLGLNPDSTKKQVDDMFTELNSRDAMTRASGGVMNQSASAAQPAAPASGGGAAGGAPGGATGGAPGATGARGTAPGGGTQSGGAYGLPTAEECAPVFEAYSKNPGLKQKLDSLNTLGNFNRIGGGRGGGRAGATRGGGAGSSQSTVSSTESQAQITGERNKIYAQLKIESGLAARCRQLDMGNGRVAGGRGQGGGAGAGSGGRGGGGRGGRGGGGGAGGGGGGGGNFNGLRGRTATKGLVFVVTGTTYEPRVVHLGLQNWEYTEILDGDLAEGDQVAILSTAAMQQQQQAARDAQRARSGGLGGLMGGAAGAGGRGGPGGGGGGPGGAGGGGRGGGGGGGGAGGGGGGRGRGGN
jgi:HlyD family secretion protein